MKGIVEEIGLTYTWLRTRDGDRLVVPNERLASETIRNSTIRSAHTVVEVTVQVPAADVRRTRRAAWCRTATQVLVTDLTADTATIVVRKHVDDEPSADRAASDLRLELADRLAQEHA